MRRSVTAVVCLLAIALVMVEAVAHDHATSTSEPQRHGCVMCTGAIDSAPDAPAPAPSTFVTSAVFEPRPTPAHRAQLDPFHSGNAPPASCALA